MDRRPIHSLCVQLFVGAANVRDSTRRGVSCARGVGSSRFIDLTPNQQAKNRSWQTLPRGVSHQQERVCGKLATGREQLGLGACECDNHPIHMGWGASRVDIFGSDKIGEQSRDWSRHAHRLQIFGTSRRFEDCRKHCYHDPVLFSRTRANCSVRGCRDDYGACLHYCHRHRVLPPARHQGHRADSVECHDDCRVEHAGVRARLGAGPGRGGGVGG